MPTFRAKKSDAGQRADIFIANKLKKFSRSALGQLFDRRFVGRGGKPIKASHRIIAGESIAVDTSLLKPAKPVSLAVIYEDDDVVVMDKPAGMLTHSKGAINDEPTVASFLQTKITDKSLGGNRAGIVHRLDRPTSGVIIGAKSQPALQKLQKQFANRQVQKKYLAVVQGKPSVDHAVVDAPIARDARRPQSFKVSPAGRPARTEYQLLKSFNRNGQKLSLLEITPQTGRTHQIRIHMAYIGHPLTGDPVYGKAADWPMLLHAKSLEISLPNGQKKTFETRPPKKFEDFLNEN